MLSGEERVAIGRIGFAETVGERIKQATGAETLDTLSREDAAGEITHALIATTPRESSEDVLLGLRRDLLPLGYLPFLLDRTFDFQNRPDTLAVLKTTDPLAPLRFAGTADPNGGQDHFAVLRVFADWQRRFEFDVLGAEADSAYLRLHTLPADRGAFAAEVYAFCPDILDQGFGIAVEEARSELPEEQQEEIERLFAADTGDAESRAERVALHLLAKTVAETHRLFLWWD